MMKLIGAMEDRAIRRYGFEAKRTIIIFKLTGLLHKLLY
jgi:hypothetical protein